jgi:DNA repair protein RecN (Recombination protein N)
MLTKLRIQDFAIIEALSLDFTTGLVVFTGETGAGKSIIFDAVEVLLGGRADTTTVRAGASQALVEGTFKITADIAAPVNAILAREELLDEEDQTELFLGREVRTAGRSIARVNGRTVNVSLLKELGELLVDLHGQSEHLSLLRTREHLGLLDRYADISTEFAAYQATYKQLQAVRRTLKELQQAEKDAAQRIERLTFQADEIDAARLQPGEEEELRAERTRLANAETLAEAAQEALQALDEGTPESPAATDLLGRVVHALASLNRLDPAHSRLHEQAQGLFETVTDLGRDLRDYLEEIEFNPRRLDFVEERLNLIQVLKRKYGSSIPEILEFAENARQELENISAREERLAELEQEAGQLLQVLGQQGQALSRARHAAGQKLSAAVQRELADLRMEGAQFEVAFERREDPQGAPIENGQRLAFSATGLEQVEFMIAPNPGEGMKPLVRIASGGETSRLMLALKNVLARADSVPTLIFDEIDQGIGGRVGVVVGQKLWVLARRHQVLCITHMPQLAAFGDQHIHVEKHIEAGRTITRVDLLSGEKRVVELAQMLGEVSEGTLHSAREILQLAKKAAVS